MLCVKCVLLVVGCVYISFKYYLNRFSIFFQLGVDVSNDHFVILCQRTVLPIHVVVQPSVNDGFLLAKRWGFRIFLTWAKEIRFFKLGMWKYMILATIPHILFLWIFFQWVISSSIMLFQYNIWVKRILGTLNLQTRSLYMVPVPFQKCKQSRK